MSQFKFSLYLNICFLIYIFPFDKYLTDMHAEIYMLILKTKYSYLKKKTSTPFSFSYIFLHSKSNLSSVIPHSTYEYIKRICIYHNKRIYLKFISRHYLTKKYTDRCLNNFVKSFFCFQSQIAVKKMFQVEN